MTLILAAIILPISVGYILISFFAKNNELYPLEALAISYGIGVGVVSLLMFFLGAFFIPLTVSNILLTITLFLAIPFLFCLRNKKFINLKFAGLKNSIAALKWYDWLILSVIFIRLILVFFQALIRPVEDIDSISYRMMEAKIFFIEKSLSLNVTPGYFVGPVYQKNYPKNISLFASWVFSAMGTWNDALVQIIFSTFLLAFAIIFYYLMRRISNRTASLFSVYLLLSLPFLIYHASTSYIDAVVAFYYCSSFLYLLLFIRSQQNTYLLVSALLAGVCVWTKNEGLPLILSNLMVLIYYLFFLDKSLLQQKFWRFLQYLFLILLFLVPWNIFRIVYRAKLPAPGEVPNFLQILNQYDRIPIVIEFFYRKALFYGNWNIAWFVLLTIILILIIKRRFQLEHFFILFAIICGMAIFGSVYFLTDVWPDLFRGTVQNRNFLTFIPLVIYFICFSVFNSKNNILDSDNNEALKLKKKNTYARNK